MNSRLFCLDLKNAEPLVVIKTPQQTGSSHSTKISNGARGSVPIRSCAIICIELGIQRRCRCHKKSIPRNSVSREIKIRRKKFRLLWDFFYPSIEVSITYRPMHVSIVPYIHGTARKYFGGFFHFRALSIDFRPILKFIFKILSHSFAESGLNQETSTKCDYELMLISVAFICCWDDFPQWGYK